MNLDLGDTQLIIKKCKKYKLTRNEAAYVLATAYWETNKTLKPIKEAYWLSESWRQSNLRYYPWYGRGYVQLTWEANYKKAGEKLGKDFTTDADVVMQPENAAEILVLGSKEGWFTGKKLSDYITDTKQNYAGARRIINGTDKKDTIAALAVQYRDALPNYNLDEPSDIGEDIDPNLLEMLINFLKGLRK